MKHHPNAAKYQKVVYWSDEDACFVGQCPALFIGGVHGRNEVAVYRELCEVVDEHLRLIERDGHRAPEPEAREYSGRFNLRVDPALHRALAARARASGDSLNRYVVRVLAGDVRRSDAMPTRRRRAAAARRTRT